MDRLSLGTLGTLAAPTSKGGRRRAIIGTASNRVPVSACSLVAGQSCISENTGRHDV